MSFFAFVLASAGMFALCLAMPRHHRDLFNTQPGTRRRAVFRVLGCALLAGCVISNLQTAPLEIALVIALAQVMLAGMLTGLGLAVGRRNRVR